MCVACVCVFDAGLGFSVAGGKDNMHVDGDNGIFITKVIPGGAAHAEGSLAVGDRVIKVRHFSSFPVGTPNTTHYTFPTHTCIRT